MKPRLNRNMLELLEGAVDIHIHSAPDVYPRLYNDIELAQQAKEMGMKAILVKNHFFETASRAQLASEVAEFPVFGGLALNLTVGGLNPHAARMALKMGAKTIWMPTFHARGFVANKSHVAIWLEKSPPTPRAFTFSMSTDRSRKRSIQLFDPIIENNSALATGHLSKPEAKVLVKAAANHGVKKIVVTHPMASFVNYSVEDMKEILDLGATFLEHVFNDTTRSVAHPISRETLFDGIKAIGADHCIMSTDAGQVVNPAPTHQMGIYIADLLDFGFSAREIRRMNFRKPVHHAGNLV